MAGGLFERCFERVEDPRMANKCRHKLLDIIIAVCATIANADRSLLPGQYVRIRLAVSEQPDALMVPQVALGSSQLGKYVYVVGKGNKADMRLVSLGPTDGALISVEKGISEGDQVISGNLQKIGPGSLVKPLP